MKRILIAALLGLLAAGFASGQSASNRAWQQRLQVEIPLPVPLVELEAVNPYSIPVDEPPQLLQSTSPRKVPIRGTAVVAAYVDNKGDCLGAVPLELPVPGLTSALMQDLTGSRFDPALAGTAPQPSWVTLEIVMEGKVKEAEILDQELTTPDPAAPPVPSMPDAMAPPGNLRSLRVTPQAQLSQLAAPRRIRVSAPGRDDEIHLRALVHINENGRCDRFVPLEIYDGLTTWFSAFLASWNLQPATRGGTPRATWMIYSARVGIQLAGLDSGTVRVLRDREYTPTDQ